MYGTRNEFWVSPGRAAEFEAHEHRLHELIGHEPGLERCSLLNSLGHPGKYVRITRWESRDAGTAFRKGAALSAYLRDHPNQGLFTIGRPVEAYEIVRTVRGDADSMSQAYAMLVDWTIESRFGNAQAFEDSRAELFELRKRYGRGLITQALCRFLGEGGRYLAMLVYASRDDLLATNDAPQVQRFMQAHPWNQHGTAPPQFEAFERVQTLARR